MSSQDSAHPPSPPSHSYHQNTSESLFRPFSGEVSFYLALEFLNSCEDAMTNSNVTADSDKISFVRSNLKADLA